MTAHKLIYIYANRDRDRSLYTKPSATFTQFAMQFITCYGLMSSS